jgi:GDP-mannose transporter
MVSEVGETSAGPGTRRQLGVVAGATIYSVSGTLLTLVNKVAIQMFPHGCLLIMIQNAMTILLLLLTTACCTGTFGKLARPSMAQLARWSPLSCLFVLMLLSSLMALKHISAVSLVVLRNLTTIVVAMGERYILGARFSRPAVATLWGMLFGAAIYGASDLLFDAKGYAWLLTNIVASSTYQIYVKALAKDESLSPLDMSFISNVISVPVLAVCSVLLREMASRESVALALASLVRPATVGVVFASGFLGYALSTSAFLLNTLVSATTIMVINNANKFAVILLSEMFMERSLGIMSTAGTLIVLYFAYMYSSTPKPSNIAAPGSGKAGTAAPADADDANGSTAGASTKTTSLYASVVLSGLLTMYTLAAKAQLSPNGTISVEQFKNGVRSLIPAPAG